MDFRILGPLEASVDGRVVDLGKGKERALLALLLLHADRVVPIDRLVDELWGERVPATAQKMVQIYVSKLRKQLPPKVIETCPPGYRLDLGSHSLDLRAFETLHARGRESLAKGSVREAATALRGALELWRGAPLAEFEEPFARVEEARLSEQHLTCLEERIDAELALALHAELVAELDTLVRRHPLRERLRGQLMLALYRCGRHAEALETFQSFRRMLHDELGIDPPPRLKELERLVLQQAPSLDIVSGKQTADVDARRTLDEQPGAEPGREPPELQRAVLREQPALDDPSVAPPGPEPAQPAETRRIVTVVAADVAPADTPDDPEAHRAVLLERTRAAEQELDLHGASVASLGGGRVLGVFGVPAAHDDDSLRAVTAALALSSSAVARRVGLSTGEVVTGDPIVSGAPLDEAVRLQERAAAGEVLAAARTWRVVRHAVSASPRDSGWVIDAVDSDAAPLFRRLETPLVGRDRELGEIADVFERAAIAGRPHLVTVFGAPGVGKTRLAAECVERLRGLGRPAVGRCRADAREATYAPLRDVLTALADGDAGAWIRRRIGTDDGAHLAEQLTAAVGLGAGSVRTEDTALATRRLLAGLALERPLVLFLDDVHWAAPAFLDLVESLVELSHAPVLVLCLARPDLLDVRPHWGGGRMSSSAVLLDALPAAESEALLDLLHSSEGLDAAAHDRILKIAEGNPLFIEQLLAAALEGELELPDSIQTLLAARLDRLDEPSRAVVQAAAVCGASFTTEDVAALVDGDPAASLVTLVRRELIRPGEAGDAGREGWSFRHALIRDVAYGSVPKRRRAELHQQLAERAIDRGTEGDPAAGSHLELAVRARRETGEEGPAVDALTAQAAEHLRRAGLAAYDREDVAASCALLERANALLPREAPERVELLLMLGDSLAWAGERDAGRALVEEARAVAEEIGDERLAARARLEMGLPTLWSEAGASPEETLRTIDDAAAVLERAADHAGLATVEVARFHVFDQCRIPDPEGRLPAALAHARKAGDRHREHHVMGWICITLPRGTVPVDEAIARIDEIVESSSSAYVHASAVGALGLLRAQRGEFEEARALVEQSRRALEELGLRQAVAAHWIAIGEVEVMADDEAAAEGAFRNALDAVTEFGDEHNAANAAWRLGLLLARQGRDDEAEQFACIAERSPTTGLWVEVWWRVVLALVEAHRSEGARARGLVEEARGLITPVPESGMHADALLESAEALRRVGDEDEAAALVGEAAGIAERLGYIVASRRAEEALRASTP